MTVHNHRLMLEASFVLSEDGLNFLAYAGAPSAVAVSSTLIAALAERQTNSLRWFAELDDESIGRLSELLASAQVFNHETARVDAKTSAVRDALLDRYDPIVAGILADEWVFLQTESLIGAKLRTAFDAFVDAGGRMREVPPRLGRRLLERTLKKSELPEHIPLTLMLRGGMKWIAAGGSSALALVTPPVGIPLGVATGVFLLVDP